MLTKSGDKIRDCLDLIKFHLKPIIQIAKIKFWL